MTSDMRAYYVGTDKGVYEFINTSPSSSTSWNSLPDQSSVWTDADQAGAGISAVGWEDQVRFFQIIGGELVQAALSNETWTEGFV